MAAIDKLFELVVESNGSDLHLEQGLKPRIRRNGVLEELDDHDKLNEKTILQLMQEIADTDSWQKFLMSGDLDFAYTLNKDSRFRANYYRHFFGYGCVFRLIPSEILPLANLNLPDVLTKFVEFRSGLVLITGPTGSGKSTTLASLIDHANNTLSKKIVTIEEPVEFIHRNKTCLITHREVGFDTQSFSQGLRGAIKSGVDIILVGEMRDKETIELALSAAEMGILVLGTLHTNSATKTIDRIIDVFPTRQKQQIRSILAFTLRGVLAQQLVLRADRAGRVVTYEILQKTPGLRAIIQQGETSKLISENQLNKQAGSILMDECLQKLLNEGVITKESALMKAFDKSLFM